jgi:hypothetical protein
VTEYYLVTFFIAQCNIASKEAKDIPCVVKGQLIIATPFMFVALSVTDLNYSIFK